MEETLTVYMVESRNRDETLWWPIKPFYNYHEAEDYADSMAAIRVATNSKSMAYYWRVTEWSATRTPEGVSQ